MSVLTPGQGLENQKYQLNNYFPVITFKIRNSWLLLNIFKILHLTQKYLYMLWSSSEKMELKF